MSLSPDGEFMVFSRGSVKMIHTAEWDGAIEEWTNITNLSIGSGGFSWEGGPSLYHDGTALWIYYAPSNGGPADEIWRTKRRPDGTWQPGEPVPGCTNTEIDHPGDPMFDGQKLYFRSWISVSRNDLFVAEYDSENDLFQFCSSAPLSEINDGSYNCHAQALDGGNTLLFTSDRATSEDIWCSTLEGVTWTSPEPLPGPINTNATETTAWCSAARSTLYFSRDGVASGCPKGESSSFSRQFL